MNYTNDDADKSIRQRNFIVTVYLIPFLPIISICCLIYFGFISKIILQRDMLVGIVALSSLGALWSSSNKKKWLKMPDGTFHYVQHTSLSKNTTINEPSSYEEEFYYSKNAIILSSVQGVIILCVGVFMGINYAKIKFIVFPSLVTLAGLYLTFPNLRKLFEHKPQLKLAKSGFWTKDLGFIHWGDVKRATLSQMKQRDGTTTTYLEISLKGTQFEAVNQPDHRILIDDLKNTEHIGMKITNLMDSYNEQKNQNLSKN
jgi:hypothetical protein